MTLKKIAFFKNNEIMKYIITIALLFLTHFNVQAQNKLPENVYRHYTGTIAGQKVSAELWSVNGVLEGRYEYLKYQENISLSFITQAYGVYLFGENVEPNNPKDKYPIWKVQFKDHQLTGNWMSADKKKLYPIKLTEDYPKGVTRFTSGYNQQSYPAFPHTHDSASYDISWMYPIALGNDSSSKWFNNQMKDLLGVPHAISYKEGIKNTDLKLLKDYKEIAKEAQNSEDRMSFQLDWFTLTQISVIYNKNGYVQLDDFEEGYTGGAHPNHSESNLIYDMKNQRMIRLSDITTMDSIHLQKLIETQFRKDYGLSPTDSLNKILFDNYLPPTENFAFSQQGIQFIYNPYEVASYATGIIYVFIPYKKLEGTLVPEFKRRMHLCSKSAAIYHRKKGESATDFVNRLKPDSATLVKNQVVETQEFGFPGILSFYDFPFMYKGAQQGTNIKGYLWISVGNNRYQRIKIGRFYQDGGSPLIHSVFFANADHQPGRELVVICKIPQRHYDYGGTFYETYFFHYDKKKQFLRVDGLSQQFFGCECSFRDGRKKTAKYKTAAEVREKLREMGF